MNIYNHPIFDQTVLASLPGSVLLPGGLSVELFTAPSALNPSQTLSNFTLATFTGYVSKPIAGWTAQYLNSAGAWEIANTTALHWAPTDGVTPNIVLGYLVRSGTALYWAELFANPVPMIDTTSSIILVPTFNLPVGAFGGSGNLLP